MTTNVGSLYLYHFNCSETNYIECQVAYWLWRTVPFTLLAVGIFGNILNIIVLSSQRMRTYPSTVYLIFMAGSDSAVLLTNLLPYTILAITGIRMENLSQFWCRVNLWFLYTSGEFSVSLLVLLTIERLLLTKAPLMTREKLTPKMSFIASIFLLAFLVALNAHFVAGFKHYMSIEEVKEELGDAQVHFPCTFTSKKYMDFFTGVNGIVTLIVFNIIPSTIIVMGNIAIAVDIIMRRKRMNKIYATRERSVAVESTTKNNAATAQTTMDIPLQELPFEQASQKVEEQTNSRLQSTRNMTNNERKQGEIFQRHSTTVVAKVTNVKRTRSPNRTLFTLSVFFIATTFPFGLYFVLLGNVGYLSERDIAKWQLLTVVVLICAWSNYTFNFLLYFVSGTLFKQEWNRIVRKAKNKFHNLFQ